MTELIKGDRVVCVNDKLSPLENGKEYVIEDVVYIGEYAILLEGVLGRSFYPERFVKLGIETK